MNETNLSKERQMQEVASVDMSQVKNEIMTKAQNKEELQRIVSKIDLEEPNTIVVFGEDSAKAITTVSDKLLHSMELTQVEASGEMLSQLNSIMGRFDVKDFSKKESMLSKMFAKGKGQIERLMGKYHSMGDEVDKVYVLLKGYENEIYDANKELQNMFMANISYYEELEKYIQAGKIGVEEVQNVILPQLEQKAQETQLQTDNARVGDVKQMGQMLQQRIYDLELAQNVAFQSLATIKMIQKGNYELVRKINTAFIVTIPIFKDCLATSVYLKRQEVQAKATKALEDRTKEMLLKRAELTAEQTKNITQMASSSFVDVATLEETWAIITRGIEETRAVERETLKNNEAERLKLSEMKTMASQHLRG